MGWDGRDEYPNGAYISSQSQFRAEWYRQRVNGENRRVERMLNPLREKNEGTYRGGGE